MSKITLEISYAGVTDIDAYSYSLEIYKNSLGIEYFTLLNYKYYSRYHQKLYKALPSLNAACCYLNLILLDKKRYELNSTITFHNVHGDSKTIRATCSNCYYRRDIAIFYPALLAYEDVEKDDFGKPFRILLAHHICKGIG